MPWLVAGAALALRGPWTELSAPNHCPALLELVSIEALRLQPTLTAGAVIMVLHVAAIAIALVCLVTVLHRATGSLPAAAAVGLAIGVGPTFTRALAPPTEAAAVAVCAELLLVAGRRLVAALAIATIAACLLPPWTALASLVGCVLVWRGLRVGPWLRGLAALAGGVMVAASPVIVVRLGAATAIASPAVTDCLWSTALSRHAVWATMSTLSGLASPPMFALAALGAFAELGRRGPLFLAAIVIAVMLATAPALGSGPSQQALLSPAVLMVGWLAAAGLREVLVEIGTSWRARVAAAILLTLVPLFELSRGHWQERDDFVRPAGHDRVTARQVAGIVNLIGPRSALVEEDAAIDLLVRAAAAARASRRPPIVPRDATAVERALAEVSVFAFPIAQEDLSLRGFTMRPVPVAHPGHGEDVRPIEGVAQVAGRRGCVQPGPEWTDLDGVGAAGRIAFSVDARAATEPGAMILYFGGDAPFEPSPSPDGWDVRVRRGFAPAVVFNRLTPAAAERFDREAEAAGLTGHPVFRAPYVVRLTIHRTPRAPLALPILLGGPFPIGVGRLQQPGPAVGHPIVCSAPPTRISGF